MKCLLWVFEEKWSCCKEVWLNPEPSSMGEIRNNIRLRIPQGHHFTQQAVTVYACNFLSIWHWCRIAQHQLWLCCKPWESNKQMIFCLKLRCNNLHSANIIQTVCTVAFPENLSAILTTVVQSTTANAIPSISPKFRTSVWLSLALDRSNLNNLVK